jgi:aminodeoxyfutalosine synthase
MNMMKNKGRNGGLDTIAHKIHSGQRLDREDGLAILEATDLVAVGRLADAVRRQRHGRRAFFVYNQHLNYTNVCQNKCAFCAFARDEGQAGAFTLGLDEIERRLTDRLDEPITEYHVVGGVNPALPFDYYLDLIRLLKRLRPGAAIKAFTAVEIDHLGKISGLGLTGTLAALKRAGLEMMPGGGAEVFSPRVRRELFPRKIDHQRWLQVMRAAHQAGLTSNATMLYGHLETDEERVDHLLMLRGLQDETGGFSAFIPLGFHPANTRLAARRGPTAADDLKVTALARLLLDNFDHIKAYWVMLGESLAQVALSFGADDLDGTIIEEKISHMAGAQSAKGLSREKLREMIVRAGFEPVERDAFYRPMDAQEAA